MTLPEHLIKEHRTADIMVEVTVAGAVPDGDLVQLPNGFGYLQGDVVMLTQEQFEQIDPAHIDSGLLTYEIRNLRFGPEGAGAADVAEASALALTFNPVSPIAAPGTTQCVVTLTFPLGTEELTAEEIAAMEVVFESDNEAAATVDETGLVQTVAAGTANISATIGDLTDSAALTVT